MTKSRIRPLAFALRSELFVKLAAMEEAGLPARSALAALAGETTTELTSRARAAELAVARGVELATAGETTGLFTSLEATLVRAATAGGSPAAVYRRLAEQCEERTAHLRRVKSRLALPAAVFVLAAFVGPIPALASGQLTVSGYLNASLFLVVKVFAAGYVLVKLPGWLSGGFLKTLGLGDATALAMMRAPLFGKTYVRRHVTNFLETLGLLLEAGLPVADAVPKAATVVGIPQVRRSLAAMTPSLQAGRSLAVGFEANRYIGSGCLDLVKTGEASGRLPEMLRRCARDERERVRSFDDQAADWLPRLVYIGVAAWMAASLLSAGPPAPPL